MQEEIAKAEDAVPQGTIHIVQALRLTGLYKGVAACLLHDIPFSAIYFPAYNHMERSVFWGGYNGKKLTFMQTLVSAAAA